MARQSEAGGGALLRRMRECVEYTDPMTGLHAAEQAIAEELNRLGGDYARAGLVFKKGVAPRGWAAIRELEKGAGA